MVKEVVAFPKQSSYKLNSISMATSLSEGAVSKRESSQRKQDTQDKDKELDKNTGWKRTAIIKITTANICTDSVPNSNENAS